MKCTHEKLEANANCYRLTNKQGEVTNYMTDFTVHCAICGTKFRFIGAPMGVSSSQPMVSADGTELRAPMEPVK
jgi:hypothetical protein